MSLRNPGRSTFALLTLSLSAGVFASGPREARAQERESGQGWSAKGALDEFVIGPTKELLITPEMEAADLETLKTPEKKAIDAAITRARASGRKVLIRMATVWCSGCQLIDKLLADTNGDTVLEDLLARYETVKIKRNFVMNPTFRTPS